MPTDHHGSLRPEFPEAPTTDWERRDRLEKVRVARWALVGAVAGVAVGIAINAVTHRTGWRAAATLFTSIPATALLLLGGVFWFPDAAGRGVMRILAPNAGVAPRQSSYSHLQAKIAAGDIMGAVAAYEAAMVEEPTSIVLRMQAVELFAGPAKNPVRAAELLIAMRRLAGLAPQQDLYTSQRLIDLYDGPLGQPHRSLSELRRIVERHPGAREAAFARDALARRRAAEPPAR
ncbi:MAG TPA: hypothetical protein VHM67_16540 [Gemmatimonadaceae bacterium]|nr:hypothetical protein [Gemmatimonadaceae bacterium]